MHPTFEAWNKITRTADAGDPLLGRPGSRLRIFRGDTEFTFAPSLQFGERRPGTKLVAIARTFSGWPSDDLRRSSIAKGSPLALSAGSRSGTRSLDPMHPSFDAWNRIIVLSAPRLADALAVTGWKTLVQPFGQGHMQFMVGPNLLAVLSPVDGRPGVDATARFLHLHLLLTDDFFAPGAIVTTEALPSFSMLGKRIPCTAVEARAHFRAAGAREVMVETESETIRMTHEGRTKFMFRALTGRTITDPGATRLVSVSNLFRSDVSGPPALISVDPEFPGWPPFSPSRDSE